MRRMIITAIVAVLALLPTPALAGPKTLTGDESRYPHAIRLEHGEHKGDILVAVDRWQTVDIWRSNKYGKKFKPAAVFSDALGISTQCCGHLYELPQRVGALPAGTVLWAGTVGLREETMRARIWRSFDGGSTWAYLSECAQASGLNGLWEPELSVDALGRLNCYFADESLWRVGHSQYIGRTVSVDGVSWSGKEKVVAVSPAGYRPGMPHVRRLPGGEFYMSYEICGQRNQYFCEAYRRVSADGVSWGDPGWYGERQVTAAGKYFAHTPSIALAPNGTAAGRMILVGQMLMAADGSVDAGNGKTLFVSEVGGKGGWYEVPAPVQVPLARDSICPNFHPALVASLDGRGVVQFASDWDAGGVVCRTSWGIGGLPAFP